MDSLPKQDALLPQFLFRSKEALEKHNFREALHFADKAIRLDKRSGFAWYFGFLALMALKEKNSLFFYAESFLSTEDASDLTPFVAATLALLQEDTEAAVIAWTKALDGRYHEKAKDLLEKLRLNYPLPESARDGEVFLLCPLPEITSLLNEPASSLETQDDSPPPKWQSFKKFFSLKQLLIILLLLSTAILIFLFRDDISKSLNFVRGKESSYFQIPSKIELMTNVPDRKNILHYYKEKQAVRDDFEKAKSLLAKKKINQGRYLLNKIRFSNADYATRQKAEYYLHFIPIPPVESFQDFISPAEIFTKPKLYRDSVVLWKWYNVKILKKPDGFIYTGMVFLKNNNKKQGEQIPVAGFFPKKNRGFLVPDKTTYDSRFVYGIFKGLVGSRKTIYLEILQVW